MKETAELAKQLTRGDYSPIDFKRIYIPKDPNNLDRGFRPLGVPAALFFEGGEYCYTV